MQVFPGGMVVTNLPANAGDAVLIPGSERSPGAGNGNPLQYFAWKIPWTEESGGLHYIPWDHTELDTTECARTHTHTRTQCAL